MGVNQVLKLPREFSNFIERQGSNVTEHQGDNTIGHQGSNVTERQGDNTIGHQGSNVTEHQGDRDDLMLRPYRVVVAKPGLDGHDRGAKVIARYLRDAGFEVIYTGLHQTPEQVAQAVIEEDADAVGLSLLSGAHMTLVPRIVQLIRDNGREDVTVVCGGIIPDGDIPKLKEAGVAEVFTPGAPLPSISAWLETCLDARETREAS